MKKRLVSLENVSDETLVAALSVRAKEPIPTELTAVYHALLGQFSSQGRVIETAAKISRRVSAGSLLEELQFRQAMYARRSRAMNEAETR